MINSAINIIGKEKCTGCFGCANSCSFNAIRMKISMDGFYFPEIDENKCTDCGLCKSYCPVLNYIPCNYSKEDIRVYASYSTNNNIRDLSSSGGIFTEISEKVIRENGVVFGAAWEKDLSVKHIGVEKKDELSKLRSSKYVQSNLDNTYSQIVKHLEKENRKVLFTGTPCQVAALKTFTDNKNLYTMDVVCHGIPSKTVFDEYIKYISNGSKVLSYTFRDKSLGWSNYKVKMIMENKDNYECITKKDPFFHGFICDLYSNLACYNCKFSSIPRTGDLTMGDFWKVSQDLMDERGVSLILVNNEKGRALLQEVAEQGKIELHSKTLDEAIVGNPRVHNGYLNMRKNRNKILSKIRKEGFKNIYDNFIKNTDRYTPDA